MYFPRYVPILSEIEFIVEDILLKREDPQESPAGGKQTIFLKLFLKLSIGHCTNMFKLFFFFKYI